MTLFIYLSPMGGLQIPLLPKAKGLGCLLTPMEIHLSAGISSKWFWAPCLHFCLCRSALPGSHRVGTNGELIPCNPGWEEQYTAHPSRMICHAIPCLSSLFASDTGTARTKTMTARTWDTHCNNLHISLEAPPDLCFSSRFLLGAANEQWPHLRDTAWNALPQYHIPRNRCLCKHGEMEPGSCRATYLKAIHHPLPCCQPNLHDGAGKPRLGQAGMCPGGLWMFPEKRSHNLSGLTLPVFCYPHHVEIFSHIYFKPPVFQLAPTVPCLIIGCYWEESGSILLTLNLYILIFNIYLIYIFNIISFHTWQFSVLDLSGDLY